MCVGHITCVEIRGQVVGVSSFPAAHGPQVSNSGHQATESSYQVQCLVGLVWFVTLV